MIIKELFEGPVGDYCIARNTIKCLFNIDKEPPMCNIFKGTDHYGMSLFKRLQNPHLNLIFITSCVLSSMSNAFKDIYPHQYNC